MKVSDRLVESASAKFRQGLVIHSPAMQKIFQTAQRLAASSIPVLIIGETGSGKELVARAIHGGGARRHRPLQCVNCGGIPTNLAESTLFGHERGSFTSANQQTVGVFESAQGGTVLLDEVGELPPNAQTVLLRVLETKRFNRVGSTKDIRVDVRVVAATHEDLETMVKQGRFREDLLYRLNALTLEIPPLRERPEEIEPLIHFFLKLATQAGESAVEHIEPEALDLLKRYTWPGNVRELRNAIEHALVIAPSATITTEDLPQRVRQAQSPFFAPQTSAGLQAEVKRYEAELILQALAECDWNRQKAAQALQLPLRTLAYKMRSHHIKKSAYQKTMP